MDNVKFGRYCKIPAVFYFCRFVGPACISLRNRCISRRKGFWFANLMYNNINILKAPYQKRGPNNRVYTQMLFNRLKLICFRRFSAEGANRQTIEAWRHYDEEKIVGRFALPYPGCRFAAHHGLGGRNRLLKAQGIYRSRRQF